MSFKNELPDQIRRRIKINGVSSVAVKLTIPTADEIDSLPLFSQLQFNPGPSIAYFPSREIGKDGAREMYMQAWKGLRQHVVVTDWYDDDITNSVNFKFIPEICKCMLGHLMKIRKIQEQELAVGDNLVINGRTARITCLTKNFMYGLTKAWTEQNQVPAFINPLHIR